MDNKFHDFKFQLYGTYVFSIYVVKELIIYAAILYQLEKVF